MNTILTKKFRHLIGVLFFTSIFLVSCVQESDKETVNYEITANLDESLSESLDLMYDDPTLALTQLDGVIKQADEINSSYYSGKAKWYKAYIYDDILEDVAMAYTQYYEALEDVLQTDDVSLKMNIYNNLGLLYRMYEQYDAAIFNYEEALKLETKLSKEDLSDLYYNYGVALELKGGEESFVRAEEAFTKSLEFAKEINYYENIASVYNEIGLMYKKLDNYEIARLSYSNTIKTFQNDPDMRQYVGIAYHNIGDSYLTEGKFPEAQKAFEKALDFKTVSSSIFLTKYDLGTTLLKIGQTDQAIATWKEALTEKHNKNSIEHVKIYSDLTKVLSAENQVDEALSYSEMYNNNVQNILAQGEKYKILNERILFANVVSEYDAFKKSTPLLSRPSVLIVGLLIFGGLIFVLAFAYYKRKAQRRITETISRIQTEFLNIKVD